LSKRRFKAIFFDLDGTLVDIHGPLYLAARKALESLGHTPQLTRAHYWDSLARSDMTMGLPPHLASDYAKLAFAYFVAEIDATERLEVLPHVAETLAELKRRDYETGVITSRPGDPTRLVEKLAMVGLASHLDHVVTQSTATLKALDKTESLKRTAIKASAHPRTCIYVGDEPRDVMAAANAGYGAIISVATGPASYEFLSNLPEFRPHRVMRSMAELLSVVEQLEDQRIDS